LPRDIVYDVLFRLPVKSLCRLQCVCTEWRAIISDPAFLAEHKSRAEPVPILVTPYYPKGEGRVLRLMDLDGNVDR
jgi:hypothetical protein